MNQRPPSHKPYPAYYFRMWHGMVASAWLRLLIRNRFAVSPKRLPLALQVSIYSLINSIFTVLQQIIFARRIALCEITKPPIFIIGHWRTGTTFLHELLALDDRFVAPRTLECFAPGHFLVSGWLLRRLAYFLPAKRPMDEMAVSWDRPQEDEFALLNSGLDSPYEMLVFPNHRPASTNFLNLTEVTPRQVEQWKAGLINFLKQVQFRSSREEGHPTGTRRLVLKSPAHTARLHILRTLFPEAQFIHLVRDPCEVFASTVQLWSALCETQGCQTPRLGPLPNGAPAIEQYVLHTMELLYRDFFPQLASLPAGNFCEVRYEDLTRRPVEELRRIYKRLGLGGFEAFQPRLEAHLQARGRYEPSTRAITEECKTQVSRRWRWYLDRFNYRVTPATECVAVLGSTGNGP